MSRAYSQENDNIRDIENIHNCSVESLAPKVLKDISFLFFMPKQFKFIQFYHYEGNLLVPCIWCFHLTVFSSSSHTVEERGEGRKGCRKFFCRKLASKVDSYSRTYTHLGGLVKCFHNGGVNLYGPSPWDA